MTFRYSIALPWLVALAAFATPVAAQQTPPTSGQQQPAAGDQTPPPLEVSVTGGTSAPLGIAIPAMPTSEAVNTPAGRTDALGRDLAQIVSNDLRNSGLFKPVGADALKSVGYPEVTAPSFDYWGSAGAQ